MKSQKPKVLITDGVHPLLIEGLQSDGFDIVYDTEVTPDEVQRTLASYTGIVINSRMHMTREMIDAGENLRFIARLGSGKEIIDLDYAAEKHVAVITSPEGNANAVAEHAMGMLLTLMNKILIGDRRVRAFFWDREDNRGMELEGKTVGIVGYGHTGRKLSEKLSSFDVKVLAYDKYKKHFADDIRYVHETGLKELQSESDIISLHVPLTNETEGMVDTPFLSECKKGVFLINTSRGGVVKTPDLISALESKHVAGAALDVFENEKPGTMSDPEKAMYEKLFSLDNTVLTPHVAGWTHESKYKLAEVVLQRIRRLDPPVFA